MLDQRKAAILRAVIKAYVKTGQPVGSKALAERYRVRVSPATIRNEMGVLEELGYITQPHTSAGRIPTDLGYRWFIDNWPTASWPSLRDNEKRAIDDTLRGEFTGIDDALDSTSQILSTVTEATAVVVAPPARKNRLRRIELLRRDNRHATILLIADSGIVHQGIVEFASPMKEEDLDQLARSLNDELIGIAFEDLASKLTDLTQISKEERAAISPVVEKILVSELTDKIYRGGTANILSPDKFADLATAHEVVGALERPTVISELIEAARKAGTMLVFIGSEVPVQQMRACAVIFAPYVAGSDTQGTLGVVGPTRMDYPHTISAVEAVARALSELLEQES